LLAFGSQNLGAPTSQKWHVSGEVERQAGYIGKAGKA
jgi:hypothetical protein